MRAENGNHSVASGTSWSISGIQCYLSGQPISTFGATRSPDENPSVRFDRIQDQPVKNRAFKSPQDFYSTSNATARATGYFSCKAFYDPSLFRNCDLNGVRPRNEGNPWRFGAMQRNSVNIRRRGYADENFGISKLIPIHENVTVDFRAGILDAFNRHIFARPNSDLYSGNLSLGQISGLISGLRNVQFRSRITY